MTNRSHTYAVMGATGHVGKIVAERLLRTGAQVRVIGRNAGRLTRLVDQGAIPYTSEFLADLTFQGHTAFEFFGPRLVTMQEATTLLGKAIGKPDLKYVQFQYEDAEKAMVKAGLSPDAARLMIEMNRSFNEGLIRPTQSMTLDHLGTTDIAAFAKTFAAAFGAATRKQ